MAALQPASPPERANDVVLGLNAHVLRLGLTEEDLAAKVGCPSAHIARAEREGNVEHLSVGHLRRFEATIGVDLYAHAACGEKAQELTAMVGAFLADRPGGATLDEISEAFRIPPGVADVTIAALRNQLVGFGMTVVCPNGTFRIGSAAESAHFVARLESFALDSLSDDEVEIVLDIWIAEVQDAMRMLTAYTQEDRHLIAGLIGRGVVLANGNAVALNEVVFDSLRPLLVSRLPYRDWRIREEP